MLDAKLWVARSTRARDAFLLSVTGIFVSVAPFVVGVAQLVRAEDCGSSGRGFKSRHSPHFCCKALQYNYLR